MIDQTTRLRHLGNITGLVRLSGESVPMELVGLSIDLGAMIYCATTVGGYASNHYLPMMEELQAALGSALDELRKCHLEHTAAYGMLTGQVLTLRSFLQSVNAGRDSDRGCH